MLNVYHGIIILPQFMGLWLLDGVWIGWLDLLTLLVSTSNYITTADLHTSQFTTAPAKTFPVCCVLTSHSLATVSKSGDSSASHAQVLLSQPPVQNSVNSLSNDNCQLWNSQSSSLLQLPTILLPSGLNYLTAISRGTLIYSSAGLGSSLYNLQADPTQNTVSSIVAWVFVSAGTCSPSCCSKMADYWFVYFMAMAAPITIFIISSSYWFYHVCLCLSQQF
jgi:hypothetical protein